MRRLREYLHELAQHAGEAWNRFWFQPSDGYDLCVLRIFVGGLALVWQLSYTPDLIRWFGPVGWFDAGVLSQWLTAESTLEFSGRLSYLYNPSPAWLWACHVLGSLVLLALTLGCFTRVAAPLAFVVVLAYVHRAPFLCSAADMVLTMLLAYLCLAPCGRAWSVDARWRPRADHEPSGWATLARRLLQVHLVAIYAIMALSKLGSATWWNGEAIWWLSAQTLSKNTDLSGLRQVPVLLNLWTYAVLIAEFSFVLLVWNRWFRPLVLAAVTVSWISIGIAQGNWALPATMMVANLAFVPAWLWREWLSGAQRTAT